MKPHLTKLMGRYKTDNLVQITPEAFKKHILSKIGSVDYKSEGYTKAELSKQRDLTIKFRWGHNHDFGTFKVDGQMHNRHISLMKNFCEHFPIDLQDFKGKSVLDIGCWNGGTSLLLAAMGANKVVGVEEVKKYADMANFLFDAFGLDNCSTISKSLYALNYDNDFDIIYFPGVIYHITDPIVALRILFNACKVGGKILVESAGIDSNKSICGYQGCQMFHGGSKGALNRGGWNWFLPSTGALKLMVENVGFENVKAKFIGGRVYAYGEKKSANAAITRAGLSRSDIP